MLTQCVFHGFVVDIPVDTILYYCNIPENYVINSLLPVKIFNKSNF